MMTAKAAVVTVIDVLRVGNRMLSSGSIGLSILGCRG
jgi:hypothetical protein